MPRLTAERIVLIALSVVVASTVNAGWRTLPVTLADSIVATQEEGQRPAESTADQEAGTGEKQSKIPPAMTEYMGRRIAQTMHYLGAEWLIRDRREREERCSMMLANLGVKPRMTICDMGCGNGFHTLRLAEMTGPQGMVIGVDIQPEMLELMRERMENEGVENIIPILGSFHNPRLPANSVDLLLMVDVYHEFSHPEQMLAAIHRALKPDGLAVLVEYRAEDPEVPIKPLHKMSKKQVNRELTANGFVLRKEFDRLPWQHMMFFGKATVEDEASVNGETPVPGGSTGQIK